MKKKFGRKIQYRAELTWKHGGTLTLSPMSGAGPLFDTQKQALKEIDLFLNGPSGASIKLMKLFRVITTMAKVWKS